MIAVFNTGLFLEQAVASVKASRYPNIEIIVVDDGSTDPVTLTVWEGLTGVTKLSKDNGGAASAFNAGLAVASGEFVLPVDGDDMIHRDFIPMAVRALQRNSDLDYVGCYDRSIGLFNVVHSRVGYVPELMLFLHTEGVRSKLFRRTVLDAVGGYDECLPTLDDWELQIRLAKHGAAGDVLPRVLYFYRRHSNSLTFTMSHDVFLSEVPHMLAKHEDLVAAHAPTSILHLLYLWKNSVNLSWSSRWLAGPGQEPCGEKGDNDP